MVLISFWCYPDPDPYHLKLTRPNDTDPDQKHCLLLATILINNVARKNTNYCKNNLSIYKCSKGKQKSCRQTMQMYFMH